MLAIRGDDDPAQLIAPQRSGRSHDLNNLARQRMMRMDHPHIPHRRILFRGLLLIVLRSDTPTRRGIGFRMAANTKAVTCATAYRLPAHTLYRE